MRAALVTATGMTVVDDVEYEQPGQGEVLVEVRWCSVCHSDVSALDGVTPPPLPCVLGHEASGVVREVGLGVADLEIGDHVVLTMVGPCGACRECLRGAPVACTRSGRLGGLTTDGSTRLSIGGERVWRALRVGAFAEYAVVRQESVVRIPRDLPLDLACVLGCAVQTGYGAVRNVAEVAPGSAVAVIGLGAVGIAAVQSARIAGASLVIGIDPLPSRRALALKLGATSALDPSDATPDAVRVLHGGELLDTVVDSVSNAATIRQGVAIVGFRGTVVLLGIRAFTEEFTLPTTELVMSQKRVVGCALGNCVPNRDIPVLVDLWRQGRLDLASMVTGRQDLSEIAEAFEDVRQGRGLRTAVAVCADGGVD